MTDKRRGKQGRGKASLVGRLVGKRRPGVVLLVALSALAAIGVPMNALFFQDGRHPAPLFAAHAPAPAEKSAANTAIAPTPPARPNSGAQAKAATRTEADRVWTEPSKSVAAKTDGKTDGKSETPRASDKPRDLIGRLLDGGAPKAESADKNVLYAQRALAKLGYALRADGVLGGTTRQAIEKFERDSGLPVKGELTAKLIRQLGARAGLARQ